MDIKFGDLLNELLQLRGWSAAKLAKALNIDSSYVRRWIRGERTPALNSNYIKQMVDVLNEGLDKEYKQTTKLSFVHGVEKILGRFDNRVSLHAQMEQALQESQIYSLTLDHELRKVRKLSDRPAHVVGLLKHTQRQSSSDILLSNGSSEMFKNKPIPKAIQGREEVLSAAISMIKEAMMGSGDTVKHEIFLTLQSEREYFDGYPELYSYWQETIIHALDSGWNMKQLCKLNKNVGRSLKLVNQIMDWTNYQGTYALYYFNKYGILNPPFEIILVEGKSALLCFAAENHSEVDSAIYINDFDSVQVIEKFAKMMFLEVEPLVRTLELEEYFELNATKDSKSGNHLLVHYDLNFLTVPYHLMEKYVEITIPDRDESKLHLKRIADCLQSFNRDIQKHKMCHIYPMRAFVHLVETGKHARNYYFRPTSEDIKEHLQHLIELLRTYEGFEIALVSDNQLELLNQTEWEIKGDHTITLGIAAKNDKSGSVALLTITEGTILGAIQEYFWDLWERIIPIHRDKAYVISWLEERMLSM